MLQLKIQDILRATLPEHSGNEGWIGVSPKGDAYHVVVPVDVQIARGVMACNRPTDGTPFGGYSGWLYFRCPPYDETPGHESRSREEQALKTAADLIRFLKSYDIESELAAEASVAHAEAIHESKQFTKSSPVNCAGRVSRPLGTESRTLSCTSCGKTWPNLAQFLRDPGVKVSQYKACVDDFNKGTYEFYHSCGSSVSVPAARCVRTRAYGKSLVGSHACPGLCYYEKSVLGCSALCEGSPYRRIAGKLAFRTRNKE
jgi:hypothetical protein